MDIRSLTQKAKEICTGTSKKVINKMAKYRVWLVVVAALTVMVMLMSMVLVKRRNVSIIVDGKEVAAFSTLKQETAEWLEIAGVSLNDGDKMTVKDNTVHIDRAFYVTVVADGVNTTFKTIKCSVAQAIEKAGVTYTDADNITMSLDETVKADDKIVIYRMTSETVTETETLKYETIEKKTDKLYEGEKKVDTEGKNGKKEYVYEVVYTDGVETERKLVSETVVKEPVDKVILIGTKKIPPKVTTASTPTTYKKVYQMNASAYTYGEDGGNVTCLGIRPYKGIVAVDPSVIPLGTKLYIETSDGKYVYGEAVAGDKGSAIKGMKIDLFLNSEAECRKFGRRTVNVYVID